MEESKKKPIMIGVIIVCLAVAGIITYSRSGGGDTIDSISEEEMTWVKCANDGCGAEYQTSLKGYFKYIKANTDPMAPTAAPLVCEKCGEKSVYRAEKCTNPDCGIVFFRNSVPGDLADRCPKCNHSETEESRDRRKREMAGG